MTKITRANWIFKKWSASLVERDKKYESISSNFDELFYELSTCGITFEQAEQFVDMAVSAHAPSLDIIRIVYSKRTYQRELTFKEFQDKWISNIKDKAILSFSAFFDNEVETKQQFGSMSIREYTAARKYVESFPTIDPNTMPEINVDDLFDLGDLDD